jgi:RNA polymerase sigma-70 factor (sigma-E family)
MQTGMRPGFEEYVAARSGALLRFAYVLCGDRHLAEDLVQEVLVKAHRRWSAIEADNPEAYVKQALVRTHVSWLRRRASSEVATATFVEGTGGGFDEAHASRDEVWAMLARLPKAQRAVLVLRYFEDLDDRRIAELVGVSTSTVRTHAHRGLATLRETLAQKANEAPAGAGMVDSVRRGAARAALRRRAVTAGGIAVILAALVLLIPLLVPDRQRPPIEPTPSATVTSHLALVPTTAPAFPAAVTYLPPGLDPAAHVWMSDGQLYLSFWTTPPADEAISIHASSSMSEGPGPNGHTSSVTVHGASANLYEWRTGESTAAVEWQQDGHWLYADALRRGGVSATELVRLADRMTSGSTTNASSVPIARIASFGLPPGYTPYEWTDSGVCARPATTEFTPYLCVGLVSAGEVAQFMPHTQDLVIDGDAAFVYRIAPGSGGALPYDPGSEWLVVQRPDGTFVGISFGPLYGYPEPLFTTDDLIAIYHAVTFQR